MRLLVLAATSLAAGLALAQTADPERDASRSSPRQEQSRAGTVTNPPAPGSIGGTGPRSGEPEAPASRAPQPATPHADGAVKQQAQEKRRAALEHCQTMTGESRTDCVQRADAEYRRATSDDTLSGERAPGPSLG
jgi:hypothetical protein